MKTKLILVFAIIALILLVPASCVFYVFQYKMDYTIGNTTCTFWSTVYACYIMPYEYKELSLPTHDYIIVPTTIRDISIFVAEDIIYVISHNSDPAQNRVFFSSDESKYKIFPVPPDGSDDDRDAVFAYCKKQGYPHIHLYLDPIVIYDGDRIGSDFNFGIWLLQMPVCFFEMMISSLLSILPLKQG